MIVLGSTLQKTKELLTQLGPAVAGQLGLCLPSLVSDVPNQSAQEHSMHMA